MTSQWYDGWDCAEDGHLFVIGTADCVVCGATDDAAEAPDPGTPVSG